MFWANVTKSDVKLSGKDTVVVGGMNTIEVIFSFSADWDNLTTIIAVFKTPKVLVSVDITKEKKITIPWECCDRVGDDIFIGAYGVNEEGLIINPTMWTKLGTVVDGVRIDSAIETEPTNTIFSGLLTKIDNLGNVLDDVLEISDGMSDAIETLEERTLEHREKIDTAENDIEFYSHHPNLKERENQDQHPIGAITGLVSAIGENLTIDEMMELFGGESDA